MATVKSEERCPDCKGEGWVILLVSRSRCTRCGGTGRVAVAIPAPPGAKVLADFSLADLDISIRARKCLKRLGIETVRQASRLGEGELRGLPGIDGPAVDTIRAAMRRIGLKFRGEV